jgi:hypothetical protein
MIKLGIFSDHLRAVPSFRAEQVVYSRQTEKLQVSEPSLTSPLPIYRLRMNMTNHHV